MEDMFGDVKEMGLATCKLHSILLIIKSCYHMKLIFYMDRNYFCPSKMSKFYVLNHGHIQGQNRNNPAVNSNGVWHNMKC